MSGVDASRAGGREVLKQRQARSRRRCTSGLGSSDHPLDPPSPAQRERCARVCWVQAERVRGLSRARSAEGAGTAAGQADGRTLAICRLHRSAALTHARYCSAHALPHMISTPRVVRPARNANCPPALASEALTCRPGHFSSAQRRHSRAPPCHA